MKETTKTSFYDFDVDVKENDKLIALVTCSRFYGVNDKRQFVVVGRMLRDGEEVENYEVTETKNYKEIKAKLKGDEEDVEA